MGKRVRQRLLNDAIGGQPNVIGESLERADDLQLHRETRLAELVN